MADTKNINNFIDMTQTIFDSALENLSQAEYVYFMAKIESATTRTLKEFSRQSRKIKTAVRLSRQRM